MEEPDVRLRATSKGTAIVTPSFRTKINCPSTTPSGLPLFTPSGTVFPSSSDASASSAVSEAPYQMLNSTVFPSASIVGDW